MTEIRTSTAIFNTLTNESLVSSHAGITEATKQINSGKATSNYAGILEKSTVNEYLYIKSEATLTGIRSKNNELLGRKMDNMADIADNLQSVLRKAFTLVQQTASPASNNDLNSIIVANNYLGSIQSLLNSKSFDGQALFAGSKIVSEAVVDLQIASNLDVNGSVTANYYKGDFVISEQIISRTQTISYGVLASDPAIQNLIGGLNSLKDAATSNDPFIHSDKLAKAHEMLQTSRNLLAELKLNINSNLKAVDDQKAIDQVMLIRIEDSRSSIEDVDLNIAFERLIAMEGQYKIACTLAARVGKFNLADYL